MNRTSSNASDVFSSYLSPLSSKGVPSKDDKKCSLPPTLPRKQLHKIDEHSSLSSCKGADDDGHHDQGVDGAEDLGCNSIDI